MSVSSSSLSGPVPGLESLPKLLTTAWRLDADDDRRFMRQIKQTDWTVSRLAEMYIKAQLNSWSKEDHKDDFLVSKEPHSLSFLSAGAIINVLEGSDNLDADIRTIERSLNRTTLRQILRDPRTSYKVLRRFLAQLPENGPLHAAEPIAGLVDVDEAVLRNEHYVRSRGSEANKDNKGLVSLEEFAAIVGKPSRDPDEPLLVRRKDPPKGGFEFLDENRQRTISILPHSQAFAKTFERVTCGILRGLDWTNVFVAGGMALRTLVHTDQSKDKDRSIRDCDIDLYLYGLNAAEANIKVDEIYDVWSRNLPATNTQKLVVKNAKTINLLADFPNRRIQIVLKLLPSPTQVLLNFDLDACAVGFDGTHVYMLPRCARALETGYSTVTMDLIWGHFLGDRRATRETRVFAYADRGFGLRILPSYAKSLEEDDLPRKAFKILEQDDLAGKDKDDGDPAKAEWHQPTSIMLWRSRYHSLCDYRKPDGQEPGLKTLKRVAFLGKDFVHRFYFGATALALPDEYRFSEDEWQEAYDAEEKDIERLKELNDLRKASGSPLEGPFIVLSAMDTQSGHRSLPYGRTSVGVFEMFMRHCEAWRLDAKGDATLDRIELTSTVYDPDTYDDTPQYVWDEGFRADVFARRIDTDNDKLFGDLRRAICDKLQIPYQQSGYRNYLTRRIRRQVHGPDLASVKEKQITIPLMIPLELENYIVNDLPQSCTDLPQHYTDTRVLIPVHNPSTHVSTAILPSLHDSAGDNLRYWVISNETMWACQHRAVDEIFEVLWSLFHLTNWVTWSNFQISTTSPEAVWHVARSFRRRVILPEIPTTGPIGTPASEQRSGSTKSNISVREALLFRPWILREPAVAYRHHTVDWDGSCELFNEENYVYPVPDELFWKEADEGDWDGEYVPQWRDVEGDDGPVELGKARNMVTYHAPRRPS